MNNEVPLAFWFYEKKNDVRVNITFTAYETLRIVQVNDYRKCSVPTRKICRSHKYQR
jgi:hypothetical protein